MHTYFNELYNEIGNDRELLIELTSDFKHIVNDNIEPLKNAINDKNYYKISRIAHKLKGASMNFNMPVFTNAAEVIEYIGKDEDENLSEALSQLETMQEEFNNFKSQIKTV